ncbi:PAS domain-containing sensor histidine kinase [Tenacibaculum sp. SG-28]|uniref:sensor histidine kinase n=1 Tax=Tenacibaculum sp. SG-28 TaxID=754426 RepID=UPI000CF36B88|nr:ATP-binding protein [Tenacibaculum sp. SG-28]PQJ21886.1 two-component sensor histidine kinase [Tenacibaculum sp. SG-28]
MILLILLTSILIAIVTYRQYEVHTEEYNIQRFGRKEEATKQNIDIILDKTTYPLTSGNLSKIFQDRIYEVALIHKLTISIYDMDGKLLKSSIPFDFEKDQTISLSKETLEKLAVNSNHRVTEDKKEGGITHLSSFTYINDNRFKRIGVLELRIAQNNLDQKRELEDFMSNLSLVYMLMFVIAILLAYFLSSYITRSIQTISEKIKETRLNKRNEKITLESASSEINSLIESYNNMIDQLEESAVKLARSEREQAWKEMAKQVAHEIKNPLTPMRLSVQSFERKFDAHDPNIKEKLAEYSSTLIQQIDVMSSIASAFSDFAKMPRQKREKIDVIQVVKHALDIFVEEYIIYHPKQEELVAYLDKSQLIRIVTNLVKNAIQAIDKSNPKPRVEVTVNEISDNVVIEVRDNGMGIGEENIDLIFEPKFTTKTSGMGLGLPMIKKIIETYDGSIEFKSNKGKGTVFTVTLPKK